MQYGICLLSVVPCRREPSGKSEMVTQLLFGEHYSVLNQQEDWLRIRTAMDEYECWISIKQHNTLAERTFHQIQKHKPRFTADLVYIIHDKSSGRSFPVTAGCHLPFADERHQMEFDGYSFSYDGAVADLQVRKKANDILSTAFLFLHAPYLWGGRSPFGIDCSGFTQLVFRLNGYKLPRDSQQQVEQGETLNFADEASAGDLAFFDNAEGKIVHVGILIGKDQIIHASGSVRIDRFDHYGIHNQEMRKYSHSLRVIKRII
jgi:gamma-D-glutamyl-L-lysine dipeptidyl-peptidase